MKRGGAREIRAWLALFVAAIALGCQSEVDPNSVSAVVVAYGEFEVRNGLPVLSSTASSIQCEEGRIFGVDYRIDIANGEYGSVPVEFRWIHPELAVPERRLWGRESQARLPNPHLPWRQKSLTGRVLWSLEHPDELVSGRYEFQIRRLDDKSILLSRPFDVVGC